jgi:nitrate reductase NapE component
MTIRSTFKTFLFVAAIALWALLAAAAHAIGRKR